MEQRIDLAIQTNDYGTLSSIFNSSAAQQVQTWQSLGQGEQRTLAAHFIKSAVSSKTFLPLAFSSPSAVMVMRTTLGHLPPTVENAADNRLRHLLFEHLVSEDVQDYRQAASILSGTRTEDTDESSVYYAPPATRCDVHVKIAECFLQVDDVVEADAAVARAGGVVEAIERPDEHVALVLRYRSVYARVLDANRKFLAAATKYLELSQVGAAGADSGVVAAHSDLVDEEDLLVMLGRAATCAILAPSSPQRQRVLGLVFKDERLSQLDAIPEFHTHSTILTKMHKHQIVRNDDLIAFEESLADHQKAVMGDGLTIVQRAIIEHNMVAVGKLYDSIYLTELGVLLGVSSDRAEKLAAKMIVDGSIRGSIDQVDGLLNFPSTSSALERWDSTITGFCLQLNRVTDAVRQI